MTPHNGPPERERPGAHHDAEPNQQQVEDDTTTCTHSNADQPVCEWHAPQDLLNQLRRRNDAARRMPPLPHSGRRDPLTARERADGWRRASLDCCPHDSVCHCTTPPLSEKMIDAGRDAALHVLAAGKVPLLEFEVLRALYRRDGDDRALAEEVHRLGGWVVA